jgi:hypothetical protein
MAGAGGRFGRLYFYKGFGLAYERPKVEKDIRGAAIMRRLGMKVARYMAGTMLAEILYREIPEGKSGSSAR